MMLNYLRIFSYVMLSSVVNEKSYNIEEVDSYNVFERIIQRQTGSKEQSFSKKYMINIAKKNPKFWVEKIGPDYFT